MNCRFPLTSSIWQRHVAVMSSSCVLYWRPAGGVTDLLMEAVCVHRSAEL